MQRLAARGVLLLGLCACERSTQTAVEQGTETAQLRPSTDASPTGSPRRAPEPPSSPVSPVDLRGVSHALATTLPGETPRVYARHLRTWIHRQPDSRSPRVGYLRAGQSVAVRGGPAGTRGCAGGWRPVEPEGFVCLGFAATLEREDPVFEAFEHFPPRLDQKLPYRYGTVRNPGVVFQRLPDRSELAEAEPDFAQRMPLWLAAGGEIGASYRQDVWEWGQAPPDPRQAYESRLSRGIPPFLGPSERLPNPTSVPRPATLVLERMEPRVGYAFLDTFFHEGRRYGLSTQLELVPTDRLRPIVGSAHHGVQIGVDVELPFAFVRRKGARFRDGTPAVYWQVLPLSGKKRQLDGRLHYETQDGRYISDLYASEVRSALNMPGWGKKGEKWIDVSIARQVLTLYEGETPVYATLVSTGEAGLDSAEDTTATKRGIFRIHTKHVSSTMSSDEAGEEFELRDVPYVQYFAAGGYALHGAYWHDRFGTPKSHGCINLTPEDARRIFWWTDPPVPLGWHGALSALRGTVVFVHP